MEVGFLDTWRPALPMIVGQRGLFDDFAFTTSHFARLTAVEAREEFDRRFGVPPVRP